MDCVFCKIVNGDIPSLKVYEDDTALVFMDIAKDVDGHMVAIPKRHCTSILDCDRNSLLGLMDAVALVSRHCVEKCGYSGVNLLNASGESAGQSVPHFHLHIIPRTDDDGVDAWPLFNGAKCDVNDVFEKIKMK